MLAWKTKTNGMAEGMKNGMIYLLPFGISGSSKHSFYNHLEICCFMDL